MMFIAYIEDISVLGVIRADGVRSQIRVPIFKPTGYRTRNPNVESCIVYRGKDAMIDRCTLETTGEGKSMRQVFE